MNHHDRSEPLPGTDENPSDEGGNVSESFTFEELDFELELALERRSVIQAADRLLRAEYGIADAPVLIVQRNRPFH